MKNLDQTTQYRLDTIKLDNFNVRDCNSGMSKEGRFTQHNHN